ncbi:SAP DNA-binding domain-containing protein [Cavenderia fasciculata]|uniref:SAP DNA-binding domain-containing protein n=1 Tax=Cavenderia fasciculata TaxID=261658 RepID=F4PKR4_CACFS|nr:SAP DNA-binding domain-containing protein [Cavenderia fasciculata]EGG24188.1 SAP DNA-binding domain-containing protein [Cavenderia fasciculata]|eukprot:XP_004362039.1 SAP DNA-binding domain-containing protein [Cavenderia fasciculata]
MNKAKCSIISLALNAIVSMIRDIAKRLLDECHNLMVIAKRKTVGPKEVTVATKVTIHEIGCQRVSKLALFFITGVIDCLAQKVINASIDQSVLDKKNRLNSNHIRLALGCKKETTSSSLNLLKFHTIHLLYLLKYERDIAERIIEEAQCMVAKESKKTITVREIQFATRIILDGAVAMHAIVQGMFAVESGGEKKERLTLKVSWYQQLFEEMGYRTQKLAPLYLTAVIEYVLIEILELSYMHAMEEKETEITPGHIRHIISRDWELFKVFPRSSVIAGAGLLRYIDPKTEVITKSNDSDDQEDNNSSHNDDDDDNQDDDDDEDDDDDDEDDEEDDDEQEQEVEQEDEEVENLEHLFSELDPNLEGTQEQLNNNNNNNNNVIFKCNGPTEHPLKVWCQQEFDECYFYLEEPISRSKIAAFDMDDTLIRTKSGAKFAQSQSDWLFWDDKVPSKIAEYYRLGYQIVIVTNQGGIGIHGRHDHTKFSQVSGKIQDLFRFWNMPCIAIMACDVDGLWRKPSKLMWNFLVEECTDGSVSINSKDCIYVGDAAGRPDNWKSGKKKDFASSDLGFALSSGIAFKTPEEFFLDEPPFVFDQTVGANGIISSDKIPKVATTGDIIQGGANIIPPFQRQELVIMVGLPASGKSTFTETHFVPAGYSRVNRDTLKTKEACYKACQFALDQGKSVVIDNTNPSKEDRKVFIDMAKKLGLPIRCFRMNTPLDLAQHLNYFRERKQGVKHVPNIGYNMFNKCLQEPQLNEGIDEINHVNFILNINPNDVSNWNIPKPK